MKRSAIVLLGILVSGCAHLVPGIYDFRDGSGIFVQFDFQGSGAYKQRFYDGSCLWMEFNGRWKINASGTELKLNPLDGRMRTNCADEWRSNIGRETKERVRRIDSDGFDLFLDADEKGPSRWQRYRLQ